MADRKGARRPVDTFGVLIGVVFLAVAAIGLTGHFWWRLDGNVKWIAAGVAAAVGIGMVLSTLPGRRGRTSRRS